MIKITTTVIAIALCLWGCKPNTRFFSKNNITLIGLLHDGAVKYTNIEFGSYKSFYLTNSKYVFQWEDGGMVDLRCPESALQYILSKGTRRNASPNWPKDTFKYTIPPCSFYIRKEKLISITVNTIVYKTENLQISADGTSFYQLPLSEVDAIQLFGEPDKKNDVWIQ